MYFIFNMCVSVCVMLKHPIRDLFHSVAQKPILRFVKKHNPKTSVASGSITLFDWHIFFIDTFSRYKNDFSGFVLHLFPRSWRFHFLLCFALSFIWFFVVELVLSHSRSKCLSVLLGPASERELLMCSLISDCLEGLGYEHRVEMSGQPWSASARLDKSHKSFAVLSHFYHHFHI